MTHPATVLTLRILLIPIVAVWVYHLFQRRWQERGTRKRTASLWLTLVLIGVWALAYGLARFRMDDLYLVPVGFAALVVLVWQKSAIFPYRRHCAQCGRPLSATRILFLDSNACERCEPDLKEGETTR
ncbi:MAG TPA: hypothetical protein VMV03_10940 [Spirochaetia bacterium]|nr:hypothetical protein [Spirochaetia bacterium]